MPFFFVELKTQDELMAQLREKCAPVGLGKPYHRGTQGAARTLETLTIARLTDTRPRPSLGPHGDTTLALSRNACSA